jgi:hypothetical protein
MLMRTGADHEIELPVTVTPLGAIARLEHALAISRASRSAIASVSPMRERRGFASYQFARGRRVRLRRRAGRKSAGSLLADRSAATLALNRARRDPGPSSCAGLREAPLGQPGRDARPQLHRPARSAGRGGLRKKTEKDRRWAASATPERSIPMELKFVDPRALKDNPDKARRSKSSPQADALLLATIKAVGIVQPPVVAAGTDGGNGFVIEIGHRRVKQAIAAGSRRSPFWSSRPPRTAARCAR